MASPMKLVALSGGHWYAATVASVTLVHNSATTYSSVCVLFAEEKTLNAVRLFIYSAAGTQVNRKCTVAVWSDVNGAPGSSLASVEVTNFAAGWLDVTGFSYTLLANTQYWIVVSNTASVPATDNFLTFRNGSSNFPTVQSNLSMRGAVATTTNGSTWTKTNSNGWYAIQLEFSDTTYWGLPVAYNTILNTKVYGANYAGVLLTSPQSASINIRQAQVYIKLTGTPTGNLGCKIIVTGGSTYTSNVYAPARVTTDTVAVFMFSSPAVIPPNTTFRIVIFDSAADSSSNCYGVYSFQTRSAAESIALGQFWGSKLCTSANSGSTWDDTATTQWMLYNFAFDTSAEFAAPTFPANNQAVATLASWGFNGEYGPGEVVAEAHTAPEVLTTAVSNPGTYVSPATSIVKLSETYGPSSSYIGTYSATIAAKISSVSPNSDTTSGGGTVEVRVFGATATQGTGSIAIGGNTATIISWAPTLIICTAPAHAAGAVDVVFTNPAGDTDTYTNGFTYLATPEDPVKERIIDAIVWGLQQITTAKGYTNTVRRVYDPPVSFLEMEEFPAINVFEGEESCANSNQGSHLQTGGNNAMLHNSFVVTFDCVLTTTPNQSSARGDRIKFLADVQKYFGTNYWIPDQYGRATARNCFYQSSSPFGIESNRNDLTGMTCDFIVWYDQELINPTVRG